MLTGILILSWGGYWLYSRIFLSKEIDSLELISKEAAFTFETYQADQFWNQLVKHPSWEILSQFPAFEEISSHLIFLDSLTGKSGQVAKNLRNRQVTLSYHATGRETFDLMIGVNFGNEQAEAILEDIQSALPSTVTLKNRSYSDHPIWEFQNSQTKKNWSATLIQHVLLISPSSFLIEEAIRLNLNEADNSLKNRLQPTSTYQGLGRLILTSEGIASLLKGISPDQNSSMMQALSQRSDWVAMELTLEEEQLSFKGPTNLGQFASFLPSVQANFPVFEKIISNRTQALLHVSLDGVYETQKLKNRGFQPKSTIQGEVQTKLIDRGFLDALTGELYFAQLEDFGNQKDNLALLARTKLPEQSWATLKEFRNSVDNSSSDFYLGNEILYFPEEDFPAHLFEGKFPGFPQTHISLVGEILIFSNSASGMKVILDDINAKNTWFYASNTPGQSFNQASGFSQTLFLPKIWSKWTQEAIPSWSTFLQKYQNAFLTFPYVAFRLNQLGDQTEASLVLPFQLGNKPIAKKENSLILNPSKTASLSAPIQFGPFTARNFNDQSEDLVIQTTSNRLVLVDQSSEVVFEAPLSSPLVSEVYQIDYYKNGKLQILVATEDGIYGIDRLGNSLPGFPIKISGEKISHFSLVDYEQNRDYRLFVGTEKGNLWLFDKTGNALEGWNPNRVGSAFLDAPSHIRVPGKGDFMVVQSIDSKFHLFNRRGEGQSGSPIDFKAEIKSPLKITSASDNNLKISVISSTGELIHASFSGEISYRNQLVKENRDDVFEILSNPKGTTLWIAVRQFNQTKILNDSEELLFSIPQFGNLELSLYDFGADRKILAVTDVEQGFGFLYDGKGTMLTATPLESEGTIQITHQASANQYLIRTRSKNRILEYQMPD